jgi:hypothetical protein
MHPYDNFNSLVTGSQRDVKTRNFPPLVGQQQSFARYPLLSK